MNEIRNLLKANRKSLQGLHAIANMDFQQPFTIIENIGKFTCNSVLKAVSDGGKIDPATQNIFVIYSGVKSWDNQYYIARIRRSTFEITRETIQGYEAASGWRYLDTHTRKADFEEIRKDGKCHYFIIAQDKNLENKRITTYEVYDRFRYYNQYGRRYATVYYRNSNYYYDNILSDYDTRTIDKSGYIQQINDYERRVRKLKAERSAAAAAVWDNTEKRAEVETRIRKINSRIAELTAAPVNEIPYMKIYHCYMSISWIGILHRKPACKSRERT